MAENNIDAVIKQTQENLGKYVKKPPLTEKLLTKPPFRFLHDVFNVIIKETGCFEGLYTAEELTFENIKDRDDKMRFLQKMIDVIKIVTNKAISVRTSKIVAGHEPEKTNELLQLMADVIDQQLDWKSAVEKVNSGKEEKDTSALKPKTRATDKSKEIKNKDKVREKPKEKENKAKESKTRDAKVSSKTISPTSKDEKTKKTLSTASSKDKEKIEKANKNSKDRTAGKENKEKDKNATKKSKETTEKSRTMKKSPSPLKTEKSPSSLKTEKSPSPLKTEKSPSPVKESEKLDSRQASLEETILNKVEFKKESTKEKLESPFKSMETVQDPTTVTDHKNDRRNSKRADELAEVSSITNEIGETTYKGVEKVREPESRKSSAQRKGSSGGKSRRSSAHKTQREDQEQMQQLQQSSLNQLESLSTLNEETPAQVATALTKSTVIAAASVESLKLPQPFNNEVKRESTFTRENSKDSTSGINGRPRTSLRPPSARPASARPGAPRRRDKNVEIVLQPNDQMKMSGINVKLEAFGDLDDDGENLVIIEDANADTILDRHEDARRGGSQVDSDDATLQQQGHLVQQILETQKELVQQNENQAINKNGKDNADNTSSGLNARQSSARQMNNLRDVIQNLTKSVNPFGKLMDFIPEDIDSMQLEMTMWRDSYTQAAHELKHEKSLTESATEPMKIQLVQIEANIREYVEMIDASRTKILHNSEKVLKMLTEQ